jgi:hypothetical protein
MSSNNEPSSDERKIAEVIIALDGPRFVVEHHVEPGADSTVLDTLTGERKRWPRGDADNWCHYLNEHHRNTPVGDKFFTPDP